MNDQSSLCELLLRYLDDALSPEERTRVEELLRVDRAARALFRSLAQHAVVIADVERVQHPNAPQSQQSQSTRVSDRRSKLATIVKALVAVAALAFVAMTVRQVLPVRDGESKIIKVNALNGPVEWTGSGGRMTEELIVGKELPGGTIELMSATSWIELEFRDKSTVTLSGHSAITISEERQKELHLKHGSLSASVHPQPTDRPMLVHTPFAELKVLGTQFNVDALTDTTRLTVNEGRVRLKRLADGKEVDVTARHEVTASMQDLNGLPLSERVEAVSIWKSELKADVVRGKWVSDLWMLGMILKKAVAGGEMTEADGIQAFKNAATLDDDRGSVWADASPYGAMVVLSATQSETAPVVLGPNTRVRIQGQLRSRVSVKFGISTRKKDGGFAGKYSVEVADLHHNGNAFQIELPMNSFQEESSFGDSPIGKELSDWWCVAESMSAKLEIISVELVE